MGEYTCPHCQQPIYDDEALFCHFCGESLSRAGEGFLSRVKYSNQKVVWYFIIFVVILAFVLLISVY